MIIIVVIKRSIPVFWLVLTHTAITENPMARLTEMAATQRESLESLDCPEFQSGAFVPPRPMKQCRVALISSAGLMKRKDDNVAGNSADYRTIEHSWPDRDLLINHVSVNFDRTAFAEDINAVFPREILRQMAEEKLIDEVSSKHYSFMGCLLYTSPSPRDGLLSRMPSSA